MLLGWSCIRNIQLDGDHGADPRPNWLGDTPCFCGKRSLESSRKNVSRSHEHLMGQIQDQLAWEHPLFLWKEKSGIAEENESASHGHLEGIL